MHLVTRRGPSGGAWEQAMARVTGLLHLADDSWSRAFAFHAVNGIRSARRARVRGRRADRAIYPFRTSLHVQRPLAIRRAPRRGALAVAGRSTSSCSERTRREEGTRDDARSGLCSGTCAGVAILILAGLHMGIMHLDVILGAGTRPAGIHRLGQRGGARKERRLLVSYVLLLGRPLPRALRAPQHPLRAHGRARLRALCNVILISWDFPCSSWHVGGGGRRTTALAA